MKKACEAVASYLVVNPEDEVQHHNKQYYLSQQLATEDIFVPRKVSRMCCYYFSGLNFLNSICGVP